MEIGGWGKELGGTPADWDTGRLEASRLETGGGTYGDDCCKGKHKVSIELPTRLSQQNKSTLNGGGVREVE